MAKEYINGMKITDIATAKAYLIKKEEGDISVEEIEATLNILPNPERAERIAEIGNRGIVLSDAEGEMSVSSLIDFSGDEPVEEEQASGDIDDEKEILAAISAGGKVKLAQNISLSKGITIKKDLELDLNGKTISCDERIAMFTISNGAVVKVSNGNINAKYRAFYVTSGLLQIENGANISAQDCALNTNGANAKAIMNGGLVTAQEAGILLTTGSSFEMNGGKIVGLDNGPIMGNGTAGQGDISVVMNGGELEANIQSTGYVAVGVYMPNSGSFVMNGGKIKANGGAGVVCRGGSSELLGGEIITTAHPSLEVGKVGDSRVVVPCSAVVYDKNSKYPAMDSLEIIIGENMVLNGAHSDVEIISEEEQPNIIDNRPNANPEPIEEPENGGVE